jgi:hypothetical protein
MGNICSMHTEFQCEMVRNGSCKKTCCIYFTIIENRNKTFI